MLSTFGSQSDARVTLFNVTDCPGTVYGCDVPGYG